MFNYVVENFKKTDLILIYLFTFPITNRAMDPESNLNKFSGFWILWDLKCAYYLWHRLGYLWCVWQFTVWLCSCVCVWNLLTQLYCGICILYCSCRYLSTTYSIGGLMSGLSCLHSWCNLCKLSHTFSASEESPIMARVISGIFQMSIFSV